MNPGVAMEGLQVEDQEQCYRQASIKILERIEQRKKTRSKSLAKFVEEEVVCIDLFGLRILSLAVCRGKATDKASFLASISNLSNHEPVKRDNERLIRALKLMLYYYGILPNKFLSVH